MEQCLEFSIWEVDGKWWYRGKCGFGAGGYPTKEMAEEMASFHIRQRHSFS
jgi:hypothetical protein